MKKTNTIISSIVIIIILVGGIILFNMNKGATDIGDDKKTIDPTSSTPTLKEDGLEKIVQNIKDLESKVSENPDDFDIQFKLDQENLKKDIVIKWKKEFPKRGAFSLYVGIEGISYYIKDSDTLYDIKILFAKGEKEIKITEVNGIDINSLELYNNYYKDKDNVYYNGNIIEGADSSTFTFLNTNYSKDKNNIYYQGEILGDADYNSFEALNASYAKDNKRVYIYKKTLPGAESASFEVINLYYAKDKDNVYMLENLVVGENPKQFDPTKLTGMPELQPLIKY